MTGRDLSNPELGDLCRGLAARILAGDYRPDPARVANIPKPGTAELRTLKLPTLMDRVVGKAVNAAFSPFWERRFRALSYGFRPKRSVFRLLADLEVAVRRSDYAVVAVADVRKAFDNVAIKPLLAIHEAALGRLKLPKFGPADKAKTLGLLAAVIRGHDTSRTIGIDQGAPYSPTALNVLLNEVHDKPVAASLSGARPAGVAHRYADNLAYVVPEVAVGRDLLAQVGGLLEPAGLILKADAAVYNITAGDLVPLLGFTLLWVAKTMTVGLADAAYEHLALTLAHVKRASQTPAETARATVLGWVAAAGPAYADGLTARVTEIAVEAGFRELSKVEIEARWQSGCQRWSEHQRRARKRRNPFRA